MGDIIVCLLLIIAVFFAIKNILKNRGGCNSCGKNCGCGCSSCKK